MSFIGHQVSYVYRLNGVITFNDPIKRENHIQNHTVGKCQNNSLASMAVTFGA